MPHASPIVLIIMSVFLKLACQLIDFRSYISTDKSFENHSDITSFCSKNAQHNCQIEKVFTKFLFVH